VVSFTHQRYTAGISGLNQLLFERVKVDSRAGLGDVEKRKLLTLPRLELDHSVDLPLASRVTDYALPASCNEISKRLNFQTLETRHFKK
jgi:hypothetical protein